jgi:hypothetical protein
MWAKVIGQPRPNKFADNAREWSIDVYPDEESMKTLKKLGLTKKLRENEDGEDFITFRQKELRQDGTANEPIRIVDRNDEPWGGDLIGNGSVVDVKFVVRDYGAQKGTYIRALRVVDHVEFKSKDFAPISSDDEFFSGGKQEEKSPFEMKNGSTTTSTCKKRLPGKTVLEDLDDDLPEEYA